MRQISTILFLMLFGFARSASAQTADDLLNLLTKKGTISQGEADSIRSNYATRQRDDNTRLDSFPLSIGRLLRLSGYTQVRYQHYEQAGKYNEFDIRRARLDFQGEFSPKWGYRLLIDFVGATGAAGTAPTGGALVSPTLLDAFIAYKPLDFLKITAGQFVIPFSLENLTQDRSMETIDRSQVVSALVARKGDASNGLVDSIGNQNGRDIGIQLSGSLIRIENRYFADYYIALLNGAGINTLDNNQSKDIDARLVLHPLKILDIGTSYYNGFDKFNSSPTRSQNRIRWGTEASLNYNLLSLKGEYIKGEDGTNNPIIHEGWYVQGSYFLWAKHLQGVFRYDVYDPNTIKGKTDLTSTYYVYGLNYFFNVWTKLQVNYSRRTGNQNIQNDVFSAQLQLSF
jgi:phosphate-selective porin OprO and OprP